MRACVEQIQVPSKHANMGDSSDYRFSSLRLTKLISLPRQKPKKNVGEISSEICRGAKKGLEKSTGWGVQGLQEGCLPRPVNGKLAYGDHSLWPVRPVWEEEKKKKNLAKVQRKL